MSDTGCGEYVMCVVKMRDRGGGEYGQGLESCSCVGLGP